MDSLRKAALHRVGDHAVQRGRPPRRLRKTGAGFGRGLGRTTATTMTTLLGGPMSTTSRVSLKLYARPTFERTAYRMDNARRQLLRVASSRRAKACVSSLVEVVNAPWASEYVSPVQLYRSIGLTVTPAARTSTTTVMQDITRTARAGSCRHLTRRHGMGGTAA